MNVEYDYIVSIILLQAWAWWTSGLVNFGGLKVRLPKLEILSFALPKVAYHSKDFIDHAYVLLYLWLAWCFYKLG